MPADELGALAVDVFGADRVSVNPRLGEGGHRGDRAGRGGPDDALGGSGVLVTGSVITAGGGPHPARWAAGMTAPDPVGRPGHSAAPGPPSC